jgi:3-hydroxy-3-methylglutaryl CoA synthase
VTLLEAYHILEPTSSAAYIRNNNLSRQDVEKACSVACACIQTVIEWMESQKIKETKGES